MNAAGQTPPETATGAVSGPTRRVRAPQKRRPNGAETRSNLLDSARHLADTRSVPDFTVEDIAQGANVSRAAFYAYFENKLAICNEVAQTTQAVFVQSVTSFERGADIGETVQIGVLAFLTGFKNDRPGMRMIYELAYAEPTVRALVHDMRVQFYELWEHEFAEAVRAGQLQPFDIPLVTRLLVGMLETFCVRALRTEEYKSVKLAKDSNGATIARLWCRSLGLTD